MFIGDKVKVRKEYILKIAKKDFELAKFLANRIGEIVGFDDITWYFLVRFDNKKFSFRRFHLEKISD